MKKHTLLSTLFALIIGASNAQYTVLHSFIASTGESPRGSVTVSGNTVFGMTQAGGAHNYGCVFSMNTDGTLYKDIYDFNGTTTGANPYGSVIVSGSTLFGMTSGGGAHNNGIIFSMDTDGTRFKDVYDFKGSPNDGAIPFGKLLLIGRKLYGMTAQGGFSGLGCLFTIDSSGTGETDLLDFLGSNGSYPYGSLIQWGTTLYGMTSGGGANDSGLVFSIQTNGTGYTDIYDFNKTSGFSPQADLCISGNELFGMTSQGGVNTFGTMFRVHTDGTAFNVLYPFTFPDINPYGSLTLSGNMLYGMTTGAYFWAENGSIFLIDTTGSGYSDLAVLTGKNPGYYGSAPYGALSISQGVLYGMTSGGSQIGGFDQGVIFSYPICYLLTSSASTVNNVSCHGDNNGNALATVTGGPTPYQYSWSNGGTNVVSTNNPTGPVLSAGFYTVTVTDNNGCVSKTTVNVKQPVVLTSPATTTNNINCFGSNNGSVSTSPAGGTAPYTYAWSGGGSNPVKSGLSAGTYTITVTDNNGCISTATSTVTEPTAMVITHDSVSQVGPCNGIAAITVTGGTQPYNYLWLTGNQTTDTIKGQCAGTYCVQVTDNNGCTQTTCITVKLTTGNDNIDNSSSIRVYPNPGNGLFNVIYDPGKGEVSPPIIEIYNILGEKIIKETMLTDKSDNLIDISSQSSGIYFYRVLKQTGELVGEGKVVIQK